MRAVDPAPGSTPGALRDLPRPARGPDPRLAPAAGERATGSRAAARRAGSRGPTHPGPPLQAPCPDHVRPRGRPARSCWSPSSCCWDTRGARATPPSVNRRPRSAAPPGDVLRADSERPLPALQPARRVPALVPRGLYRAGPSARSRAKPSGDVDASSSSGRDRRPARAHRRRREHRVQPGRLDTGLGERRQDDQALDGEAGRPLPARSAAARRRSAVQRLRSTRRSGSSRRAASTRSSCGTFAGMPHERDDPRRHRRRHQRRVQPARGSLLAAGGSNGTVLLLEHAESHGAARSSVIPAGPRVRSVAFSPDGRLLAAGSGKSVVLIDARTGHELRHTADHGADGQCLRGCVQPRRRDACGRGRPRTNPALEHVATAYAASLYLDGMRTVNSLAFSSDDKALAAGGAGTTVLWDLAHPRIPPIALLGRSGGVNSVAFSPNGGILASAGADRTIALWRYPFG